MAEKKIGRPLSGQAPSKPDLVKLYVKEKLSIRAVAEAVGCSRDIIHLALKRYGIPARSKARRSKLLAISLQAIEADIKAKGVSATAKALKVDRATLRHHVKVRHGK